MEPYLRPLERVDETALADVGVSADDEGAGGRVDVGETGDMLTDLFEVGEGVFLSAHYCGHTTYLIYIIS